MCCFMWLRQPYTVLALSASSRLSSQTSAHSAAVAEGRGFPLRRRCCSSSSSFAAPGRVTTGGAPPVWVGTLLGGVHVVEDKSNSLRMLACCSAATCASSRSRRACWTRFAREGVVRFTWRPMHRRSAELWSAGVSYGSLAHKTCADWDRVIEKG